MSVVALVAPVRGWAMPLDQVPDPVFAERMMGDGVAIDPLDGIIIAPATATIAALAPTRHAVTLALANGAHLLIHVGLETVSLGGEGFEALVEEGQSVAAGTPLLRFDLDSVARRAKSLITPIVMIDPGYAIEVEAIERLVSQGDPLLTIRAEGGSRNDEMVVGKAAVRQRVTVLLPNGLHARPAARIVNLLKPLSAQVRLSSGERSADGRSLVKLLALGLKARSEVLLTADGPEAERAVAAIAALLQDGSHETAPPAAAAVARSVAESGTILSGVTAAPGFALGPLVQFRPRAIDPPRDGSGLEAETQALDAAIGSVAEDLKRSGDSGTGVAEAHLAILADPELLEDAHASIASGRGAGHAWRSATAAAAAAIRATGDALLIERIADLEDVEQQLLARLAGVGTARIPDLPPGAILVAEDLFPSQFLALGSGAAGIATARGGPTSHVAVLAASAGLPMLVAVGPAILERPDGQLAILDGVAGSIDTAPDASAIAQAQGRLAKAAKQAVEQQAAAQAECRMLDGTRIEIFANLASAADGDRALAAGAEGCGLLRTEFLFEDRAAPPSEEEQADIYAAIAASLGGRPLIVRTLDAGGDKPVAWLPPMDEDNPALGQRGIRLSLAHPTLLETQLRAILRGVPADQCRIMIPMVIERDELRSVRAMLDKVAAALGLAARVQLGIMVETPAAALLASSLAEEADFLSIGSNDLTQYALACDRGNPATAARVDALHPAVLQLIGSSAQGAHSHGKWLGICGAIASEPDAAALLIGLGASELSVAPGMIPAVKAAVRGLRLDSCQALAAKALRCASAAEVRHLIAREESHALRGAA